MQILETPTQLDRSLMAVNDDVAAVLGQEKHILIVEDDLTLRPLWEKVLKSRGPSLKVDWATSMEEAERLIRFRFKNGVPYNMVVADIFLEGEGSGIELWNRYGEEARNFVFVSALPISRYELLMSLNYGCPLYLKKPLNVQKCTEIADMVLSSDK